MIFIDFIFLQPSKNEGRFSRFLIMDVDIQGEEQSGVLLQT